MYLTCHFRAIDEAKKWDIRLIATFIRQTKFIVHVFIVHLDKGKASAIPKQYLRIWPIKSTICRSSAVTSFSLVNWLQSLYSECGQLFFVCFSPIPLLCQNPPISRHSSTFQGERMACGFLNGREKWPLKMCDSFWQYWKPRSSDSPKN